MNDKNEKLLVLWTNKDIETAKNMVFMYAGNSMIHGWWEKVILLIWGSTAKLTAENTEIQESIGFLLENGVRVIACKSCAEKYNVVEQLEKLNIEVFYTGVFLTDWLKSGQKMITI